MSRIGDDEHYWLQQEALRALRRQERDAVKKRDEAQWNELAPWAKQYIEDERAREAAERERLAREFEDELQLMSAKAKHYIGFYRYRYSGENAFRWKCHCYTLAPLPEDIDQRPSWQKEPRVLVKSPRGIEQVVDYSCFKQYRDDWKAGQEKENASRRSETENYIKRLFQDRDVESIKHAMLAEGLAKSYSDITWLMIERYVKTEVKRISSEKVKALERAGVDVAAIANIKINPRELGVSRNSYIQDLIERSKNTYFSEDEFEPTTYSYINLRDVEWYFIHVAEQQKRKLLRITCIVFALGALVGGALWMTEQSSIFQWPVRWLRDFFR